MKKLMIISIILFTFSSADEITYEVKSLFTTIEKTFEDVYFKRIINGKVEYEIQKDYKKINKKINCDNVLSIRVMEGNKLKELDFDCNQNTLIIHNVDEMIHNNEKVKKIENIKKKADYALLAKPEILVDIKIKTNGEDVTLKSGKTYFLVNGSKEMHLYQSFDNKFINEKISIDSINTIGIVENYGLEFFFSSVLMGTVFVSTREYNDGGIGFGFEKLGGLVFVSGFSIFTGVVGYLAKFEKKYELKNQNCSEKSPCTKWEVITK